MWSIANQDGSNCTSKCAIANFYVVNCAPKFLYGPANQKNKKSDHKTCFMLGSPNVFRGKLSINNIIRLSEQITSSNLNRLLLNDNRNDVKSTEYTRNNIKLPQLIQKCFHCSSPIRVVGGSQVLHWDSCIWLTHIFWRLWF